MMSGKLFAIAPGRASDAALAEPENSYSSYRVGGLTVVEVEGVLDGAITNRLRRDVLQSERDESVTERIILFDSPGGSTDGNDDLAATIRASREVKPITAIVPSVAASAAYNLAASCLRIVASPAASVGSIGVFSVLVDSSEQAALLGLRVIVVRSGRFKGLGIPGVEVTPEQIENLQRTVDGHARLFLASVAKGRRMATGRLQELADGSMYMASEAKANGLIDEVKSAHDYLEERIEYHTGQARAARASWLSQPRAKVIEAYSEAVAKETGRSLPLTSVELRRSLVDSREEYRELAEAFHKLTRSHSGA